MPIQIGQKPESDFDQPLGLLSDCHRRIERFLGVLNRIARDGGGRSLSTDEQASFESALRYFRDAAPRHTQDEEESLFPRLRSSENPEAKTTLDSLAALEAEHAVAARDHELVDTLGLKWIRDGELSADEQRRLNTALGRLSEIYSHHIVIEDAELFPLAARVLGKGELESIGEEMAARRGLRA